MLVVVGTTTPSTASTPAELLERVVSEACPSSIVPRPSANDVEFTSPDIGRPVAFVRVTDVGVPKTGVTRACELGSTTVPVNVGLSRNANVLRAAPVVMVAWYASVRNSIAPASGVVFNVPLVSLSGAVPAVADPAGKRNGDAAIIAPVPSAVRVSERLAEPVPALSRAMAFADTPIRS